MKNNYRSHSRRRTPWDADTELTGLEAFIREEYRKNYSNHHKRQNDTRDSELLDSYTPGSCRHCGSTKFKKNGLTDYGLQKYKCSDCGRTFTVTTGTIFQDHKISISEWIEYLLNIFGYSSLNLNSKTNKNAETTSKYWLAKVFLLLKDCQNTNILAGDVQIDETYYSVIKNEIVTKDGKKLRGLSRNKYCIGIGCDSNNVYCFLEGKAKTSETKTLKAFKDHIKAGSHLVHDDEKSHNVLISTLSLSSETYSSIYLKTLEDKDNPLNRLNHYCDLLKKFLNSHPGFNRDELQDYLNLFVFMMNPPHNKLEKVRLLLDLALNSHKSITFREYYKKKSSN